MKFTQRLSMARKLLTSQSLGNSIGSVIRNYSDDVTLNPQKQLTGITYKAVDKIGMAVSDYKPEPRKANGDAYVNHPIISLAKQPNPRQNAAYFHHLWAMLNEIYGETFWYMASGESSKTVKELYLLNPAQMELVFYEGELVGYKLHKLDGNIVPFTVDEIEHDMLPNPFNEWRGLSVLEKAALYVETEINTASFTLNYMRNNASPSGIVSLPAMEKNTFQKFVAQWREGYEGPKNAGKTAFIRGGEASFKAVGATLRDVDQKVTRDMAKEDVLMMLDVPKGLLGASGEKGLGRNELEPLEYIFAKYKVNPLYERLDGIYSRILNKMPRNAQQTVIEHTSVIPEDKDFKLKTHEIGVNRWLTPNEIRAEYDLPPIEGGNDLKENNTVQPIRESVRIGLKKKLTKAEQTAKLDEEREQFRKQLMDTNEHYVKLIKKEISKFVDGQEQATLDKLTAKSKAYEEILPEIKEESEALALLLIPVVIELMEAQSEGVAHFITGELLVIDESIRQQVALEIKEIAGVFNRDTIVKLERELTEGQRLGESLVKRKKRVEQVFSDARGYRAERIARTEGARNSNLTAQLTYKQNGVEEIEWFVNPGACEFCRTFVGKTKRIDENFENLGSVITGTDGGQLRVDYLDVNTPPLHPNCTCSIIPAR